MIRMKTVASLLMAVAINLGLQGPTLAQWGRSNSNQNNSDAAVIAGGIMGLIGEGIRASNSWNNNGGNSQWNRPRQYYQQPGYNWNNNAGYNWNNTGSYNYNNGYNNGYYTRPQTYAQPTYAQPTYAQPTYAQPTYAQPTYAAPPTTTYTAPRKKAEQPAKNTPPVVYVKPSPNKIVPRCKVASTADLARARKEVTSHQQKLVGTLEDVLKDYRVSPSSLITEMAGKDVSIEVQTSLLQAIKTGNAVQAQIIWSNLFKDPLRGEELFNKVELERWYNDLVEKAEAGELNAADLRDGKKLFSKLNVPNSGRQKLTEALNGLEAVSEIAAVLANIRLTQAGSMHTLPGGDLVVIRNPECTEPLWLGNGYVMAPGLDGLAIEQGASCADVLGWPVCDGSPCEEWSKSPIDGGVLILGPDDGVVSYNINGHNFKITSDKTQHLPAGKNWGITFWRDGVVKKTYKTLAAGTYKFEPSRGQWELFAKTYTVTISNRENPNDFNLVVDNRRVTIPAGDARSWTSPYPIHVKYDRGNGGEPRQIQLEKGEYTLAMNTDDQLWDVFPADQFLAGN